MTGTSLIRAKIKNSCQSILHKTDKWLKIEKWRDHADVYTKIADSKANNLSDIRIQFVAGHLDILDRKFGILLTFQGLMATIVTLYISAALPHPVTQLPSDFKVFAWVWVLTTALCVAGMAWVRWGNLGSLQKIEDENGNVPVERLRKAEDGHVWSLLRSFRSRSVLYNCAVFFTLVGIAALTWAVSHGDAASVLPGPPLSSVTMPTQAIGPFPTGVGCSDLPQLESGIAEAASNIEKDKVSGVLIIGGSDAEPISGNFTDNFGNNTGLGLTRARCVAGWLTDTLGTNNIHIDIKFSTQDAVGRSANDRRSGNPLDRIVQIRATDYQK